MKKLLLLLFVCSCTIGFAQEEEEDKYYGRLTGGFESNIQWYNDDSKLGPFEEDEHFRSNNYLKLDYNYNNWFVGLQVESYAPQPLLNFSPKLDDTGIATYYAMYRNSKLEVTAGYFYEQFGSGLILRAWEDRQLGLNNAFRGGRIHYRPTNNLSFTALYGRQREGFEVSKGDIYGFNTEIDLSDALKLDSSAFAVGLSYVGRQQDIPENIVDPEFNDLTNSFSGRIDFSGDAFYSGIEFIYKTEDIVVNEGNLIDGLVEDGNALLLNFGYSRKGLGVDVTLRKIHNIDFFSDREAKGNQFNENIVNYIPALTKQHDYGLTNIYVYQSQPGIAIPDPTAYEFGEIGGQIDIYYNFDKGTPLGGKYGTKVAFNGSYWAGLRGTFDNATKEVETEFFGFGKKYFSEASLEIRKKWSPKWRSIFYYVNQYSNRRFVEGTFGVVHTNIGVAEATYKINSKKSMRFELQHLWTPDDNKNWAGGTLEFNFTPRLSFYVNDIYNYGNDLEDEQIHFYNVGGSYAKGATRVALNYGRQRGGLVCVGGVCRFVPQSTGLTVNITTAF